MAMKNKEKYMEEMEAYKQKKEEEAESSRKEEEKHMKLQMQEALQLLKKEKTNNIIEVLHLTSAVSYIIASDFLYGSSSNRVILQKTKQQWQKKVGEKKNAEPDKPKKPASSFLLFSKETREDPIGGKAWDQSVYPHCIDCSEWKVLKSNGRHV